MKVAFGMTSTTDEASTPMPPEAGESVVGVVAGAWQQQAELSLACFEQSIKQHQ
jgi:hypothetical protein